MDHGDGRFGLRLADVFPQDSGEYRCEAYNEHGDAVTRGTLSVRGKSIQLCVLSFLDSAPHTGMKYGHDCNHTPCEWNVLP